MSHYRHPFFTRPIYSVFGMDVQPQRAQRTQRVVQKLCVLCALCGYILIIHLKTAVIGASCAGACIDE